MILRLGFIALSLVFASPAAFGQSIWHVDAAVSPGSGGPADPFCTIAEALAVAVDGDVIRVRDGTYTECLDLGTLSISLESENGAATTTIHGCGTGSVIVCAGGQGPSTVIKGFTITGGTGTGSTAGGGVYCSDTSPEIRECVFTGNSAVDGGAMAIVGGAPSVIDCVFTENVAAEGSAPGRGGAVYNAGQTTATLVGCYFSGNEGQGGGMHNDGSSPTVESCHFDANIGINYGSGMWNTGGATPLVVDCLFENHTSGADGAAMFSQGSSPTIVRCQFRDNAGSTTGIAQRGGAILSVSSDHTVIVSWIFTHNTIGLLDGLGGAIALQSGSSSEIINCTFCGNEAAFGGAIYVEGGATLTVTNSIFWENGDEIGGPGATTVNHSNIQGGWTGPGVGTITSDPLFVDPCDDLHLLSGSPCIDAGDTGAVPVAFDLDLDGAPRVEGSAIDMGAHEWAPLAFGYALSSAPVAYCPSTGGGMAIAEVAVEQTSPGASALVEGLSLSLAHDPSVIEAVGASSASALVDLLGHQPDYFQTEICSAGVTAGIIFTMPPSAGQLSFPVPTAVATIEYETVLTGLSTTSTLVTPVDFVSDACGAAIPVENTVVLAGGVSVPVSGLIGGTLVFAPRAAFVRGDCNGDGLTDIADAIFTLEELFGSGAAALCADSCDINDDGLRDVADPIALLSAMFSGGPLPPAPHPDCGCDDTPDGLDCVAFGDCP